jgi:predicted nucleic acid-binding Zn ribbon protein
MRKAKEQPLRAVLAELISMYKLKPKLSQTRIKALWSELMGPTVARYTKDIEVRGAKLYLSVDSAPLRQELAYGKEKIRERINEALGENYIQAVIFR